MTIRAAAVIGAGVMGSGIAAQIANAGVPVLLLDIVPEGAQDRSALARAALDRLAKADPAPFMSSAAARLVTPGNLEDDLGRLAEVDWIVEAVVENLDVKRALYARLEGARRQGSIVSSNTSTLPLAKLTEGLPERFRRDFLITHFFNPPRYMRLLEVVRGERTDPEAVARIAAFADRRARQERDRLQGHAGLHRQPHRLLLDAGGLQGRVRYRPDGRGGGRRHGPAARHSQDRHLRPARSRGHRSDAARRRKPARRAAVR